MVRARRRADASRLSSVASSLASSAVTTPYHSPAPSRTASRTRKGVFPFQRLPAELRLRIYELVLCQGDVVDLDPLNYRLLHPRLALFLVCSWVYAEAWPVFYGKQVFRLYPSHGRFFHTPLPLIARLPPHYRHAISAVELRLGIGWTAPPKGQNANTSLGLRDCTSLRLMKIFIEIDPSDSVFTGFRGKNATEDTYKQFCATLLLRILVQVPSLETIEIDAYPSVKKDAPLVMALRRRIEEADKKLAWGPLRGWEKDDDEPGLIGLESALAGMAISSTPSMASRLIETAA